MKKIIVYLGLSILEDEAKTILDADYRPPVKRGDILKAISEKPEEDWYNPIQKFNYIIIIL